ncbi:hypothetical protein BDK51DRAFT_26336, partial [Blyttiomyces helicus]
IRDLNVERLSFELGTIDFRKASGERMPSRRPFTTDNLDDVDSRIKVTMQLSIFVNLEEGSIVRDVTDCDYAEEAQLIVRFKTGDGEITGIEKEISLPPAIKNLETFKMPPYHTDSMLVDFVREVENNLIKASRSLRRRQEQRKELIMALVTTFAKQLLEYDSDHFSYASFLFHVPIPGSGSRPGSGVSIATTTEATADAIANVHLDDAFPDVSPEVMVLPMAITQFPAPEGFLLKYKFSPLKKAEETVAELRMTLVNQIPTLCGPP